MQHLSPQIPPVIRKWYKVIFHGLLISIVYAFWLVYVRKYIHTLNDLLRILMYATTYILIIYLNIYYIFNRFFLKGKFKTYIAASLLSFLIGTCILQRIYSSSWQEFYDFLYKISFYTEAFMLFILYISFTGLGISYRLLQMYIEGERKISALTNASLKAELTSLKNQVSPHFLFNTLNNLYVLTKTDAQKAAETVLQLSDLMKYQLYECNHDRVPLEREMEYIRNILHIEQLRKDNWDIRMHLPSAIPGHIHIEPLLFICLVENAIKHGTQLCERGYLAADLQVSEKDLCFTIRNTTPSVKPARNQEGEHIGLHNLQRRLELLYPGRHHFETSDTPELYTAILRLNL